MTRLRCPDCRHPQASLGEVVTSAELMAALEDRGATESLAFDPDHRGGECLVYMLRCELCGEQSLNSIERLELEEDPEPIG